MKIEIYRVSEHPYSSGFDHLTVCRDCAIKELENGKYVEFDIWANKFPEGFDGSICNICSEEIKIQDSIVLIKGVEY